MAARDDPHGGRDAQVMAPAVRRRRRSHPQRHRALNLTTIVWAYGSFDYDGPSVQAMVDQNYENLIARAKNGTFHNAGTIMCVLLRSPFLLRMLTANPSRLTHELKNFTMQTAGDYYPQLKAAFTHRVPVVGPPPLLRSCS